MGDKLLPGIFVGYEVFAGGGWTGDLLVVDWEKLNDAANYSDVNIKRFKAPEVQVIKYDDDFIFPLARGDLEQPGPRVREVRQRRSRILQDRQRLARGEQHPRVSSAPPDAETPLEPPEYEPETEAEEAERIHRVHPRVEPGHTEAADEVAPEPPTDMPTATSDFWTCNADCLVRHHRTPRTHLFVPTEVTVLSH